MTISSPLSFESNRLVPSILIKQKVLNKENLSYKLDVGFIFIITKDQNIGKYGYIGNWILWKYRKISVDIFTKISVRLKFFIF